MQLSLAIGKKGQNVRLAAKLLGWKIDIKSEEEKRREVEAQMSALVGGGAETPLSDLAGVLDESILEALNQSGISTIEELGGLTPEQLQEIPGVGEEAIESIFVAVNQFFGASLEGEVLPEEAAGNEELLTGAEETDLDSSGQTLEAERVRGIMEADAADVAEVPSDSGQEPAADSAASMAGDLQSGEESQASEQSPEAEK
jgi:N utilization substance protein A